MDGDDRKHRNFAAIKVSELSGGAALLFNNERTLRCKSNVGLSHEMHKRGAELLKGSCYHIVIAYSLGNYIEYIFFGFCWMLRMV